MKAIVVTDPAAGVAGMHYAELDEPHPAENDVVVRVLASGFTPGELRWPGTWTDRAGRDRTPSVPGHEFAGVVAGLGYGTTGLSIGQQVLGLTDWTRNGTLAESVAVEARNLVPWPADIPAVAAAALPISGLTAWQAVVTHGRLNAGQKVLITGAGGAVGTLAVQIAQEIGAHVVGAGRARDREALLRAGAIDVLDTESEDLLDVGEVDLVVDVLGGEIARRATALVRTGGTFVTIAGPPEIRPVGVRTVFFVVEADREQLSELVQRVRSGRLIPQVGSQATFDNAVEAFTAEDRPRGRTIITMP